MKRLDGIAVFNVEVIAKVQLSGHRVCMCIYIYIYIYI